MHIVSRSITFTQHTVLCYDRPAPRENRYNDDLLPRMDDVARIFLCHASEDKPQVREVYARLKALGFEPWLDEEEILPGQDWDFEIEKALEESDFVMVFLSKRSVEKIGYVQREFRRAMYRAEEMPEGFIHTIPVKLDDCTVPRRFSRHQWANLYEEGAFDRIVRALYYGLEQRGAPAPEPNDAVAPPLPAAQPGPERPQRVDAAPPPAPARVVESPETFTNDLGMQFARIPAGEFLMGSTGSGQHRVLIRQPFYLGIHPVTQAQWEAVMGTTVQEQQKQASYDVGLRGEGADYPMFYVSWEDVQEFMQRLNTREDGYTYALPSEAGSMPAEPDPPPPIALAMTRRSSSSMPGTTTMQAASRIRLGKKSPMPGASMTCMATSGSGYRIGMAITHRNW